MKTNQALLPDDLYDLIRQRRSIRRFDQRPVPSDCVNRLLEAALWAPSAHNRQPWRFVLVNSEANRLLLVDRMSEKLAADLRADGAKLDLIAADIRRSRNRLLSAPVLLVICLTMADMDSYPDPIRQSHEHTMAAQSVAMAAQNILLAAHAEGLGACWVCAPLFCQEIVQFALELPADYEPQGIIIMGFPAENRAKTRQPIETRLIVR